MKNLLLSLLVFIFVSSAYSQENIIGEINEYCEKIDSYISENETNLSYYFMQNIHYISNLRAIGRQDTKVTFFYPPPEDEYYDENDETKHKLNYFPPDKVKINYNIAASMDINIAYYFQDGHVILYHGISRGAYYCIEEKYYFDGKGKLLKIKTIKPSDCPQEDVLEEKPVYEKSFGFTGEEKSVAEKILKNASEYQKTFFSLLELESLDK